MKIRYHKRFEKQFKKLPPKSKRKALKIIEKFVENSTHKSLCNHALAGKLKGLRSISISNDLRIIFEEFNDYTLVIFIDIGTHNRVYK